MTITTQNPSGRFPSVLAFEGEEVKIIDHNGQPWITASDLSRALGYSRQDHVSRIYRDNRREFTDSMSQVIALQPSKINENTDSVFSKRLPTRVRIFSPRGCYALGFFARTAKAAAFRSWVLDVLEGLAKPPVDPWATLPSTRLLVTVGANGATSAKPVAPDAYILRPADLVGWMREPGAFSEEQLLAIGVAALQQAKGRGGHGAVQQALSAVHEDYLLVNESKLTSCLYRAAGLARGRYV